MNLLYYKFKDIKEYDDNRTTDNKPAIYGNFFVHFVKRYPQEMVGQKRFSAFLGLFLLRFVSQNAVFTWVWGDAHPHVEENVQRQWNHMGENYSKQQVLKWPMIWNLYCEKANHGTF